MRHEMAEKRRFEYTLSVLKECYELVMEKDTAAEDHVFITEIMGERTIYMTGSEAAHLFSRNDMFSKEGVVPRSLEPGLSDDGSAQNLDDSAYENRRAMYMSLMDDETMEEIGFLIKYYWGTYFKGDDESETVELYEVAKRVFMQTACRWIGIPLGQEETEQRTREVAELFETPEAFGLWNRQRSSKVVEEWLAGLVEKIRRGQFIQDRSKALWMFSWHRDEDGEYLPPHEVAREILGLLRPMTAMSVWVTLMGLALHEFPEKKEALKRADEERYGWFIQEVRRYYPFFPFTVARTREEFEWKGIIFSEDTLILFDLYRMNHDPGEWSEPESFLPERFMEWQHTPFDFVPKEEAYGFGHRCVGEYLTVGMMKATLDFLVNDLEYEVPEQDFSFKFDDLPAVPNDRLKISNIKKK